jgi:septal ring factor EnvC (AmiA/AmiB activator)
MDIPITLAGLQAINIVCTGATWIYLRHEKRHDKTNERLDVLSGAIERLNRDVARVECNADAAPSHADLAKVYDSINGIAQTVNQLVGENRAQSDSLRMILNHITQGRAV